MATVSFLWHLHQPSYRTADGISHAPWAAVHAGGAYMTLAHAIDSTAATGQVINIVPTLLEQLLAYAGGSVSDPVLESVLTPATELNEDQRETLVSWAFHVDPRQLARYPRLGELASRKPDASSENRLTSRYGPGDLRDLQVLFVLAHAGLDPASPAHAFATLSFLAASTGLFATMPGIVAIMSPLAGELANATQFPLFTVLMTIVNGYTLVAFPYQVGPIVFALMLGGARFRDAVRLLLPLLVISAVVFIPLTYVWWRLLGYIG